MSLAYVFFSGEPAKNMPNRVKPQSVAAPDSYNLIIAGQELYTPPNYIDPIPHVNPYTTAVPVKVYKYQHTVREHKPLYNGYR